MLWKNVNARYLSYLSWISILVPRGNKITEPHDTTALIGDEDRTLPLHDSFSPKPCAPLHIQCIQDSIGYLAAISSAPSLDMNASNSWRVGGCSDADLHEILGCAYD